jgi:hypothetical protein
MKRDWSDLKVFDPKKAALQEAAPELLRACKAVIRDWNRISSQTNLEMPSIGKVRQAIKKSQGRE